MACRAESGSSSEKVSKKYTRITIEPESDSDDQPLKVARTVSIQENKENIIEISDQEISSDEDSNGDLSGFVVSNDVVEYENGETSKSRKFNKKQKRKRISIESDLEDEPKKQRSSNQRKLSFVDSDEDVRKSCGSSSSGSENLNEESDQSEESHRSEESDAESSSDSEVDEIFYFERPSHIEGRVAENRFQERVDEVTEKLEEIRRDCENRPSASQLEAQPKNMKINLMKHQLQGLKFLKWREGCSTPGGILADEMGLGKTAMAIALVLTNQRKYTKKKRAGGTLIVVPASIVYQWEQEFRKFCSKRSLNVFVFHGKNKEESPEKLASKCDVVIVSYNTLIKLKVFFKIDWFRLILDEGHKIRNRDTKTSKSCMELRAKNRWILTGTPIQNVHEDLFSLFKFLRCSQFDDYEKWKEFIEPSQSRLNFLFTSFMLRRRKNILNLPKLKETEINLTLSNKEQELHDFFNEIAHEILQRFLEKEEGFVFNEDEDEPLNPMFNDIFEEFDLKNFHLFVIFLRLRQITCHPLLIKKMMTVPEEDQDANEDEEDANFLFFVHEHATLVEQLVERLKSLREFNGLNVDFLSKSHFMYDEDYVSTKMEAMLNLVKEKITKNEKIIVVSAFTSYLTIIEKYLDKEGVDHVVLTGKTPIANRMKVVKDFNDPESEEKVMLMSMVAGNLGLNLEGATNMILMDVVWNPQQELQAMNRIHRIGQKKEVNIYKFVCYDSIDDRIIRAQERKLEVANAALDGRGVSFSSKMSSREMKELVGSVLRREGLEEPSTSTSNQQNNQVVPQESSEVCPIPLESLEEGFLDFDESE